MSTIKETIRKLKEERDRAVADANRFITLNDALIEDCENLQNKLEQAETLWKATAKTLQDEIDRLTKELDEERKQHSDTAAAYSDEQCKCNRLRDENVDLKKRLELAAPHWGDTIHSMQTEILQYRAENAQLLAENEKLKKALDSACDSMGVCKKSHTTLIQKLNAENAQLRKELIDEKDRYDKLTSYEQARNKMLQESKHKAKRAELAYNTVMRILERDGYDTLSLFIETGFVVASEEMKENHDRS